MLELLRPQFLVGIGRQCIRVPSRQQPMHHTIAANAACYDYASRTAPRVTLELPCRCFSQAYTLAVMYNILHSAC
jgi:hypothetical protein